MKQNKLITTLMLACCAYVGTCHAEQPKAAEYRAILNSGTFYVEYKDNFGNSRVVAARDGQRMERMNYNTPGWVTFLNPLGALFGGSAPKNPEVMYKDGYYYQFNSDKEATVLSESHLSDENLNPRQGWSSLGQKLALPEELTIFYPDSAFRGVSYAVAQPQFAETLNKTVDEKKYVCDRYISPIVHADGSEAARLVYDALYNDKGELVLITSSVVMNGTEYPHNKVAIKKILAEIPKDAFSISKKTKIYAAGNGDMNDLLEQPVEMKMEGLQ